MLRFTLVVLLLTVLATKAVEARPGRGGWGGNDGTECRRFIAGIDGLFQAFVNCSISSDDVELCTADSMGWVDNNGTFDTNAFEESILTHLNATEILSDDQKLAILNATETCVTEEAAAAFDLVGIAECIEGACAEVTSEGSSEESDESSEGSDESSEESDEFSEESDESSEESDESSEESDESSDKSG